MTDAKGMPEVSIGHVTLHTHRMRESVQFMQAIGMQMVYEGSEVSILELRGGTHLLLFPSEQAQSQDATFDLMVDDLHALYRKLVDQGYKLSMIEKHPEIGHESFAVTEPSGARIVCYSSHQTCAPA